MSVSGNTQQDVPGSMLYLGRQLVNIRNTSDVQ